MNWRPTVLAVEIWSNLRCRAVTWIVVGATSAMLVAAVTAAELDSGSRAVELRRQLDSAGANVAIVESTGQAGARSGSIDTSRCVVLNGVDGIERAGSERVLDQFELITAPGSPIVVMETSGLTAAVWDPDLAAASAVSSGAWATASLQERLGVGVGSRVVLGPMENPVEVVGVFVPTRAPQMGARLAYPASSTDRADRCWVEVTSLLSQDKLVALSSWFVADAPVVVRPLLDSSELQVDPRAQHDARPTRQAWAMVGLSIGALWVLVMRPRRGEMALLMTVGANRLCTVGQIVAEALIVAMLVWSVGAGTGILRWRLAYPPESRPSDVLSIGLTSATLTTMLAMSVTTIGIVLLSVGSQLQALKNRE